MQFERKNPKRSVRFDGRRTGVSVEAEFWDSLREIARERGMTLSNVISSINATRQHHVSLSSAIRVFVIRHYVEALTALRQKASTTQAGAEMTAGCRLEDQEEGLRAAK